MISQLLSLIYELGEQRRADRSHQGDTEPYLDVLDVNYEDVLEYYRYKHIHEQANDQEPS